MSPVPEDAECICNNECKFSRKLGYGSYTYDNANGDGVCDDTYCQEPSEWMTYYGSPVLPMSLNTRRDEVA